jgi:hypothetical protein
MIVLAPPVDAAEAVQRFARAWNTEDAAERLLLLRSCCVGEAEFTQPQGVTHGVDGFSGSIGAFLRAFPRAEVRFGPPDVHNGYVRVRWRTHFNDGAREPIFGDDFIHLDAQNRILSAVSFDHAPADG